MRDDEVWCEEVDKGNNPIPKQKMQKYVFEKK
jgi:hypothetical protein